MKELLPIIRRKRRPLIEEDAPSVAVMPPSLPVTAGPTPVEAVEIPPDALAEIAAPESTPVSPQPKRKKKNADVPEN